MKLQSESKRVCVCCSLYYKQICVPKHSPFVLSAFELLNITCTLRVCIYMYDNVMYKSVYVTLFPHTPPISFHPNGSPISCNAIHSQRNKNRQTMAIICVFASKIVFSLALWTTVEPRVKQNKHQTNAERRRRRRTKKNTYIFVMRNAWWYWIVTSSRRADINLNNTYLFVYRRIPDTTDAKTMPLPHRFGFGLHSRDDGRTVCACIFGVQWRTYVTRPFRFEFVVVIAASSVSKQRKNNITVDLYRVREPLFHSHVQFFFWILRTANKMNK